MFLKNVEALFHKRRGLKSKPGLSGSSSGCALNRARAAEGGRENATARVRQLWAALVAHPAALLLNFQPQRSRKSLRPHLTYRSVSPSFQQLYFFFHVLYNCIPSQPLLTSKPTSFALSRHTALSSHWFPCVVIAPVQGWINPRWTRMMLYHSSKD